jgi:hypothetical protein
MQIEQNISYTAEPPPAAGVLADGDFSPGYLFTGPSIYPAFAEYAEPPDLEETDGVLDTRLSIRAFLPLASQATRCNVQNYSGMATLIDSRILCLRLVLSSVLLT